MNSHAQKFLDQVGDDEAKRVCEAADTSFAHFKQICKGERTCGRKLAEKLELASEGRMTRVGLVFGDDPPPSIATTASEADRAPG